MAASAEAGAAGVCRQLRGVPWPGRQGYATVRRAKSDRCDLALWWHARQTSSPDVTNAHAGVMPAWNAKLDAVTIKMLAAYVHSLGGGEDFAKPAPSDVAAVQPVANDQCGKLNAAAPAQSFYEKRRAVFPKAVNGPFRTLKWAWMIVTLCDLLHHALAALGSRAIRPQSGGADRSGTPPLLHVRHRNLAARILFRRRPADHGGDRSVPCHQCGRSRMVRLCLPANGVDRSVTSMLTA